MVKVELSTYAIMMAKKLAHQVWEKYDDTYGYRTEKQAWNDSIRTNHPDNIWSVWNQFDSDNQRELYVLISASAHTTQNKGVKDLKKWCEIQMLETEKAVESLREKGIELEL